MKQTALNLSNFQGISELKLGELVAIDGGSFWYDAFYVVGVAAHAIIVFSQSAIEYQQSLPPNLKK